MGQLEGLRQRARAAIDARNAARKAEYEAQGGIYQPYMDEQMDPNLGTMSILSQAIDEAGQKQGKVGRGAPPISIASLRMAPLTQVK